MDGKTWSTRLDADSEEKVKKLMRETRLREAEVIRRLVVIGLKNVKDPSDLLKA